eukprot:1923104-Amphidinium_carterae.1
MNLGSWQAIVMPTGLTMVFKGKNGERFYTAQTERRTANDVMHFRGFNFELDHGGYQNRHNTTAADRRYLYDDALWPFVQTPILQYRNDVLQELRGLANDPL